MTLTRPFCDSIRERATTDPEFARALRFERSFWYLATPYSKYPAGIESAFILACRQTALLIRAGVPVFSPIAHTHPIALHAGLDPLDHTIWLPCDRPMMDAAHGLIMLKAESWEQSYGMKVELETFQTLGKPVVWMTPGFVPPEFLP